MGMALDEPQKDETATLVNEIGLLISKEVQQYADTNVIDYLETPHEKGFTIGRRGHSGC